MKQKAVCGTENADHGSRGQIDEIGSVDTGNLTQP
jgi:hypothetical protein